MSARRPQRSLDDPGLKQVTIDGRKAVLSYLREHSPASSAEISEKTGIAFNTVRRHLYNLSLFEMAKCEGKGGTCKWHFLKEPRPTIEGVSIAQPKDFLKPSPVVHKVRDGIEYTYQAAPICRWHEDIPRGSGVISQDNPGLARLAA